MIGWTNMDLQKNDFKVFFEYKESFDDLFPITWRYIQNGQVSRIFASVSKSFGNMYSHLQHLIT